MKTLTRFINLCALTGLMACIEVKDEADTGTDAIDSPDTNDEDEPELYGPDNEWYHATTDAVPSPEGCGFQQGDYACNFTMLDQNGDEVELYQFAGKYVVLDLFAEW